MCYGLARPTVKKNLDNFLNLTLVFKITQVFRFFLLKQGSRKWPLFKHHYWKHNDKPKLHGWSLILFLIIIYLPYFSLLFIQLFAYYLTPFIKLLILFYLYLFLQSPIIHSITYHCCLWCFIGVDGLYLPVDLFFIIFSVFQVFVNQVFTKIHISGQDRCRMVCL